MTLKSFLPAAALVLLLATQAVATIQAGSPPLARAQERDPRLLAVDAANPERTRRSPADRPAEATQEPTTVALAAIGLVAIGLSLRRKEAR